jgi:hypothetical protein
MASTVGAASELSDAVGTAIPHTGQASESNSVAPASTSHWWPRGHENVCDIRTSAIPFYERGVHHNKISADFARKNVDLPGGNRVFPPPQACKKNN